MSAILVTCGATVSFPALITSVMNRRVITKLKSLGYDRILVQYGKDYLESFKRKVLELDGAEELERSDIQLVNQSDGVWCARWNGVKIDGFEFSHSIEELLSKYVRLVISHAGTGSILDALRLDVPLIAVINDTLMDNHQQLIAEKFQDQGLLWSINAREEYVLKALDRSASSSLNKIGPAYNKQFEALLYSVAHR